MKIVTVVGARPQFIKAAVLARLLKQKTGIEEILVHTGQHYDENMSAIFFQELDIPRPDYHLRIGSGSHGKQTGRMIEAIEKVLLKVRPDALLVYGDTNSTLAGALAASKLHIPVAHVEAGLRSFNRRMPEEINRVLTDHLASWLFAPTTAAVHNLHKEGVDGRAVHLVGDVMYDAALYSAAKGGPQTLQKRGLKSKGYVLATIHRAENTDDPDRLGSILQAFQEVAQSIPVVLPLHPRTRAVLGQGKMLQRLTRGLILLEPVGYLDMVALERHARLIATDSGGVQKEAFFHRVSCLTLREETEWVELVELGWNTLVPPSSSKEIVAGLQKALKGRKKPPAAPAELYGGGKAGKRILEIMRRSLPTKSARVIPA